MAGHRSTSCRALVVGEALVDVTSRTGRAEVRTGGGSPFNVAIGLARLGIDTTLATQLGSDPDGDLLRGALRRAGVPLIELPPTPIRTSRAFATIDASGAATYDFELAWSPSWLPPSTAYELIHIGSLGTVVQPGADTVIAWAAAAAADGTPVSFDPNVRLGAGMEATEYKRRFHQIAEFAHAIKLSDADATVLFPESAPHEVVRRLAGRTPVAAVTLGPAGALMASGSTCVRASVPGTTVVDTIGAGDAFTAAVLAGLCDTGALRQSAVPTADLRALLDSANTAAAISCGRKGADPPTRTELHAVLAARAAP